VAQKLVNAQFGPQPILQSKGEVDEAPSKFKSLAPVWGWN
jgi:hypothetical protein